MLKTDDGWLPEHRAVMQEMLGRVVTPHESVHHKNGRKDDNRMDNLELWVRYQPRGQRVSDFLAFVVEHYRPELAAMLDNGSNRIAAL